MIPFVSRDKTDPNAERKQNYFFLHNVRKNNFVTHSYQTFEVSPTLVPRLYSQYPTHLFHVIRFNAK